MIRFLGKRTAPTKIDHSPTVHPASPASKLPSSFAAYRQKAQQHGPLGGGPIALGEIGSHSGASLGPVEPGKGVFFDRDDMGARFKRLTWTAQEIEAVESGGASLYA